MIGRTISHYRVLAQLGAGGMGVVYQAEDLRLGRMVALKMLSDHLSNRSAIERFEREARAASALNHPNICTIHEIDEFEGKPFIVMELLEGQTLKELLEKGRLPKERLLELSIEFTDALAAAHAARIIHRDLKPANLFVTKLGHLKILDFGLAKLLPELDAASQDATATAQRDLTASHMTVGTLGYMSPEQLRGEPLDARTDLYSLGVVLKEAAVPPAFDPIVNKAIEKDRELRYQSAADIRADLKRLKSEPPKKRFQWSATALGGVLLIAVIAAFAIFRARDSRTTPSAIVTPPVPAIRTIAVLPFKPIIAKERDEALEFGIADTLIAKISNIRGVTVRPLTAVRRYAGLEQDAVEAGRQLGVDAVLDGTTHNDKDKIRVTARLLRVSDAAQLWSGHYDTTFADIFSIYDAISGRLADELSLKLTADEQREVRKRDTRNPAAYRAYLLGRYYQGQIGRENFQRAIDSFRKAIAIDPEYALPYVGVANINAVLPVAADFPSSGPSQVAKEAASKAIALDPALADAYTALGWVKFWYDWDWPEAERLYQRSIALNPNYPSAHLFYGGLLSIEGRHAESLREVELAERLDPLHIQVNIIKAQSLYQAGRLDETIDYLRQVLQIHPDAWVAQLISAKAYEQKGAYDDALRQYQSSWAHSPGATEPLGRIGHLYAIRGETAKAREVLAQLTDMIAKRYVPPYNIALVHAGLGEKDEALRLLERACQERDVRVVFLKVDPAWNPIRSDPRFRKILSCANLQP
jgi:TolB-like protein/tRNA A-37 threonylcarbamoyl transferase component Bud32/Flp pilus assembly protein TadD